MLRLKEILKEKKMSEQELASKLGVTRQYVNAIVKESVHALWKHLQKSLRPWMLLLSACSMNIRNPQNHRS